MNKAVNIIERLLDILKKTLVRFRDAKCGLLFFVNIFKLPDFFTDKRVSIINKAKVVFAITVVLIYLMSGIDFIPEMILGIFGVFDDLFVLVWCLGIINEEIEKFKKIIKKDKNSNIIEDVQFHIYDEK